MSEFRRSDLDRYLKRRKRDSVGPATINREIAAVKKLFSYALETEAVEFHPLVRYRLLHEPKQARRLLTVAEQRRLVASMPNRWISALVAVLGETAMRKSDGLRLRWDQIDSASRTVSVEIGKTGEVVCIPLSEFAVEALAGVTRYMACPYVFVQPGTMTRWKNPEKAFRAGCKEAGLEWVGFHDLRRFRACRWLLGGVDIETVRDLLGHASVQTTQRYLRGIQFDRQAMTTSVRQIHQREGLQSESNGHLPATGTAVGIGTDL